MTETISEAVTALKNSWPSIVEECRAVLAGELHYQATIYHCLRLAGVPRTQLGMNVKQWIVNPGSPLFRKLDERKHESYRGGFEPVPDIVIFKEKVASDWRRRNHDVTLKQMLLVIEVKASERRDGRLGLAEIRRDIDKLAAHREEARRLDGDMQPVMLVVDTAPLESERMSTASLEGSRSFARQHDVMFLYVSPTRIEWDDWSALPGLATNSIQ